MDCKSEIKTILFDRIIVFIRDYFIADLLHRSILCGCDRKSAAIEQIVCLCLRIALYIHKILNNIFDQSVSEVRVRSSILCDGCGLKNTIIYLICHSFIIFSLGDIPLLQHITEDSFPALSILFGVCHRVISSRILCDGCNDRAFGQRQIRGGFVKVALSCSLYPETPLPQIDRVHISFQNLFFAHFFFKLQSKILLLELTFNSFKTALIDKIRKDIVFDKLLCKCAGTL